MTEPPRCSCSSSETAANENDHRGSNAGPFVTFAAPTRVLDELGPPCPKSAEAPGPKRRTDLDDYEFGFEILDESMRTFSIRTVRAGIQRTRKILRMPSSNAQMALSDAAPPPVEPCSFP